MPSGSTTLSGSITLSATTNTRAVSTAMVELSTALERQWDTETFQALDALEDALRDVEQSDFPYWENIL